MEQKNKVDLFVWLKIFFGFALLTIVLLVSLSYLYQRIIDMSNPSTIPHQQAYKKAMLTNSALVSLFQSEHSSNYFLMSPSFSSWAEYQSSIEEVEKKVEDLKTITNQPNQKFLIQQVLDFLVLKKKNMKELSSILKNNDGALLIQRNLQQFIPHDTLVNNFLVSSSITRDTIIQKLPSIPEKKSFFNRISAVFFPKNVPSDTSSFQIESVTEERIDTIQQIYHLEEHFKQIADNITQAIEQDRLQSNKKLQFKQLKLLETNVAISRHINMLLQELNEEAIEATFVSLNAKNNAIEKTSQIIAYIAILSIFIVIVFLILIGIDINKSRRYKKELERSNKQTKELLNSRHQLILGVSHDIQSPLSAILGYIELLGNTSEQDSSSAHYAKQLKSSASHIMSLSAHLLEYAQLEKDQIHLTPEVFAPNAFFADIIESLRPLSDSKKLKILFETSIPDHIFLKSDTMSLRRIVSNLFSNALKFTHQGSISIILSFDADKQILSFEVKDTGIGISLIDRQRIFEAFVRLNQEEGSYTEGIGLGLSIVHKSISLLNGNIYISGKKGEGSSFHVSLPVEVASQAPEDTEKKEKVAKIEQQTTVCIIEDDPVQLALVGEMCSSIGVHYLLASSIQECLSLIPIYQVQLVITDMHMGSFSGHDLLQSIRNASDNFTRTCPIVIMSTFDKNTEKKLADKDFQGTLRKPFSMSELKESIVAHHRAFTENERFWDLWALYHMLDHDHHAVEKILSSFVASNQEITEKLRKAEKNKDYAEVKAIVHRITPLFQQLHIHSSLILLKRINESDPLLLENEEGKQLILDLADVVQRTCDKITNLCRTA